MDSNVIAALRNQAIGQAEMFEVLSFEDVKKLSKASVIIAIQKSYLLTML